MHQFLPSATVIILSGSHRILGVSNSAQYQGELTPEGLQCSSRKASRSPWWPRPCDGPARASPPNHSSCLRGGTAAVPSLQGTHDGDEGPRLLGVQPSVLKVGLPHVNGKREDTLLYILLQLSQHIQAVGNKICVFRLSRSFYAPPPFFSHVCAFLYILQVPVQFKICIS